MDKGSLTDRTFPRLALSMLGELSNVQATVLDIGESANTTEGNLMTRRQMYDDYVARTADKGNSTYLTSRSVKNCRLSAGETAHIRTKTPVGVTGGSNTGAVSYGKEFGKGKNGRKKLAREMRARRMAK